MCRLHACHRALRHGDADINLAEDKGRQIQRTCWKLGVRKFFQIQAAGFPFICIPAVGAAFLFVPRGFSVSGKPRQKHRILKQADTHRQGDHGDENPEAEHEKTCKNSIH